MVLILLGAPGSGKGTVAQNLRHKYDVCYFSTGNLLRNEIQSGTDLGIRVKSIVGTGGLVDDDIVNEIVEKNLRNISGKTVILDGYPRTKHQAVALDNMMSGALKDKVRVIELDVDQDEIIARISKRRVCAECGNTYGPTDKACVCSGELIKRKDDEESTVRNRLKEYEKTTLPLSQYYSDRLFKVCGKGNPEDIAKAVHGICDLWIGKGG